MKTFFSFVFCTILLVTTAYSAEDSALVGSKQCQDSTYWCKSFDAAVQCNAVTHCLQTVWEVQTIDTPNSCSTCAKEVNFIRNDPSKDRRLVGLLVKNICSYTFTSDLLRSGCERKIEQHLTNHYQELVDFVHAKLEPAAICNLLDMCIADETVSRDSDEIFIRFSNVELHFPASYLHPSLGLNKCTWGPSYWCANITSSHECQSTTHCIEHSWMTKTYPEDHDSVCQVCKDMVEQAREQLQSNETQEELREVLEGSCKLLLIKPIVKECDQLADDFIPELTEMLLSEMNPTAVCTIAGLCNSERIDKLILQNTVVTKDVVLDSCTNCSVAFSEIESYLHTASKTEVLGKLLQFCGELSSFSDSCTTIVSSNFDNLYASLRTMKPWSACHLTGMCVSRYHFHGTPEDDTRLAIAKTALALQSDDLPCDLCKQLVTHFKEVLVANTTEDEFLQVLKGICLQTGKFKDECLQLVEDNFKTIYDYLTKELDPPVLCAEVNLCPKKNQITDTNLNLITGRLIISAPSLSTNPQTEVAVSGPLECRICQSVISLIQQQLDNPEVEHDIEKIVKEVCVLAPSSEQKQCDQFIDKYSNILIELLSQETDPRVVCSMMGLCPDEKPAQAYQYCKICQDLTKYLQQVLDDPTTEDTIESAVKKFCLIVPQADKKQCNEFIAQYTSLVVSVLAEEVDPNIVCPALSLCPDSQIAANRCDYCKFSMNTFMNHLETRQKDHILKKLGSFVAMSPKHMAPVTVELKLRNKDDIVDMAMAEFNGEESCTYLKFCKPPLITNDITYAGNVDTNEIVPQNQGSKPNCEICVMFVKLYESKLTSNVTEKELEDYLTKFCMHITDPELQMNCTKLIDKYVPEFIDLLKKDVTPKEICQLVQICPTLAEPQTMQRCRTCEAVIGSIEGLLRDPFVSNDVTSQLDKICELVGRKNEGVCEEIVSVVGPELEGIVLGIPSWYYCSKIKMCPYRADLIQNEDCKRGETFWCQGVSTAAVCDKLKHCQNNVWKSEKPSP